MSANKVSLFLTKLFTAAVLVIFMVVMLLVNLKFVAIHLASSGWPNEYVINLMDIIYNNSRLIMLGGFLSLSALMNLYHLQQPSFERRYERRQDIKEAMQLDNVVKSDSRPASEETPVI